MGMIKDAYDILKDISSYINEKGSPELQNKIFNLQSLFLDIKQENIELQNKIEHLNKIITQYKDVNDFEKKITWTDYGFFKVDLPEYEGLKLCKNCYITKGYKSPMVYHGGVEYFCPICKTFTLNIKESS
ncbi:MAG: hypothetical protein JEZ05_08860 [Tenericutes bacterium]|nr:hypothetical protein [Mycoplasmatota bacterium]